MLLNLKLMKYFVYVIQDSEFPLKKQFNTFDKEVSLNYKPIYVGRGCGERDKVHLVESHNKEVNKIISEKHNFIIIEKVLENLSWYESVKIEQKLIYDIGRFDLGIGTLLNRSGGINLDLSEDENISEIGTLNLEFNKINLVLKRLNSLKTKKEAADSLGISERTLYRLLKDYNIKNAKVDNKRVYYQL